MLPTNFALWTALIANSVRLVKQETDCPDPSDVIPDIFYSSQRFAMGEPQRAYKTLPERWFRLDESTIPHAGLGVYATTFIPRNTWLGSYEGIILTKEEAVDVDIAYSWTITKHGEVTYHLDAWYEEASNWLRYVNCPRHASEENVALSSCYGQVHYRTSRDIAPGEELFIYYGDTYAQLLGIDLEDYYLEGD